MTAERTPNPQPTSGTNYDSYLVPRSKTPGLQRIYDRLLELGWRFDARTMEWYTPENWPTEGHGRLAYDPDHTWAEIQLPSVMDGFGRPYRPRPLLRLEANELGQPLTTDRTE